MTFNFIVIFFGIALGGYCGYFIHRRNRAQQYESAGERIGKMVHISEGLDGYLEKKINDYKITDK
ncbi:MAG: hypothetical protein AAB795_02730 [Patescibacteria group bacterium]